MPTKTSVFVLAVLGVQLLLGLFLVLRNGVREFRAAKLEQIQFLLGHVSIQTTERWDIRKKSVDLTGR